MTDREKQLQKLRDQQKAAGSRTADREEQTPQNTPEDETPDHDDDRDLSGDQDTTPDPQDQDQDQDQGDLSDQVYQAMEDGVDGHLTTYSKELAPLFVALTQDDPDPAAEDARDKLAFWLGQQLNEPPDNFTKRSPMLAGLIRAGLYAADADGVEALQAAREAQMRQQADGL